MGIVEGFRDDRLITIEGNTNLRGIVKASVCFVAPLGNWRTSIKASYPNGMDPSL